jgi:hypothetical protein
MGRISDILLGRAVPRRWRAFDDALRALLPPQPVLEFYARPSPVWVGSDAASTFEIVAHGPANVDVRAYGDAALPAGRTDLADRYRVIWNVAGGGPEGAESSIELIDDGPERAASSIAPLLEPLRSIGVVSALVVPGDLTAFRSIDEQATAEQAARIVVDVLACVRELLPACNERFAQLA